MAPTGDPDPVTLAPVLLVPGGTPGPGSCAVAYNTLSVPLQLPADLASASSYDLTCTAAEVTATTGGTAGVYTLAAFTFSQTLSSSRLITPCTQVPLSPLR